MNQKIAYLVAGPESSETRMLTKAIISSGVFGDYGHVQRLDNLKFGDRPDKIVLRRSLPHAHAWPDLDKICTTMEAAGYEVRRVAITRNEYITALSQIRNGHAPNMNVAKSNIKTSLEKLKGFGGVSVVYGRFVNNREYREAIFSKLGLAPPAMDFYDGNKKYV